jgi:heme-degrading monooxygenase HmoA
MKIHRFVKMTFTEEGLIPFLEVFENSKELIRNFPGCLSLQLIKDMDQPFIICTSSIWENETALENYRNSDLFTKTWANTKIHFKEKAFAKSYKLLDWLG